MKITTAVQAELERVSRVTGLLRPTDVVAHASNPESPLHPLFEWDDSEAANKFRMLQAADLIRRVTIVINEPEKKEFRFRAFVSLPSDRGDHGGYRRTEDVLRDPARRAELLQTALGELHKIKERFEVLEELSEVFDAIESVKGGEVTTAA